MTTEIERKMRHFNENAPSCKAHGERPTISFDGTHFIECPKGCEMHDGENAGMDEVMMRWDQLNLK